MRFARISLLFLTLALPLSAAAAPPPALLPVQGYMTDEDGVPLDGSFKLGFVLFDAETAGASMYSTSQPVVVGNGTFTAYLGDATPLDLDVLRDNPDLWLEITIEQACADDVTCATGVLVNRTLSPRLALGSAPFAASAQYCSESETLGGKAASDFANATHTHDASAIAGGTINSARVDAYTKAAADARYAALSHNHDAAAITTGTIGSSRVDAYTKAAADARYAALSHNHDAAAITTGTISSSRVDAYTKAAADAAFQPTLNVSGEYNAASGSRGEDTTSMGTKTFCALTRTQFEGGTTEAGIYRYCEIRVSNNVWTLVARSDNNTTTQCTARCF